MAERDVYLWRWKSGDEWLADAKAAMMIWMESHKRELGHMGQREMAELIEKSVCSSFKSTPGGGKSGVEGASLVTAITLDLPNAVPVKGGGKPKVEHVKLECTIESSCEGETRLVDATYRISHGGLGKADDYLVEYSVKGAKTLRQGSESTSGVQEEMVLTERALLASSKEKLVPSLDEQVDFIEFMCSVPMLPKEIQRRAITCAVEDVIEEACWDEDDSGDEDEDDEGGEDKVASFTKAGAPTDGSGSHRMAGLQVTSADLTDAQTTERDNAPESKVVLTGQGPVVHEKQLSRADLRKAKKGKPS